MINPFAIDYKKYPKNIQALYRIWLKAGIWRKCDWYDFLAELVKILEKIK